MSNIDASQGGARQLTQYLDKIEGYIKLLEFNKANEPSGRKYDINNKEVHEFGLDGNSNWKLNTDLGYMPHFVLDLVKDLQRFNDFANDPTDMRSSFEVFKDQIDLWERPGGIIDRIKSRTSVNQEYYSRNPYLFMNKYLHEVTSYNHSTSIKTELQGVKNMLLESLRASKDLGDPEHVEMFVNQASEQLKILMDNTLNTNAKPNTWGDSVSRFFTAWQFTRLMGWNIRTGGRNYGQQLIERIKLGFNQRGAAKKYLSETDNVQSMQLEAEKHGILWARDTSLLLKWQDAWTKSDRGLSNVEQGTRGAIDRGGNDLLPGLIERTNERGEIEIVLDPSKGSNSILDALESVAVKSSVIHSAIESINRAGTFRTSYARAHENLSKAPEWYIQDAMNMPNASRSQQRQWINNFAGKLAYNVTSEVHFEYARWEKASILTSKTGKVIGQFQHYRFNLIDLQYNIAKRGIRDLLAHNVVGAFKGEYSRQALRHSMSYSIISAITIGTGINLSNLLNNDNKEFIENHINYWTAERLSDGSLTYSKGGFADFGATVGAFIEFGEIFSLWQVDQTTAIPWLTSIDQSTGALKYKDNNTAYRDRSYKLLKLLNTQAARTAFKTVPSIRNGNTVQGLMGEMGLFTDYDVHKKHKGFWQWVRANSSWWGDKKSNKAPGGWN